MTERSVIQKYLLNMIFEGEKILNVIGFFFKTINNFKAFVYESRNDP